MFQTVVDSINVVVVGVIVVVHMTSRRGCMDEKAVGPGRARERGEPVVADSELAGKGGQHRQFIGRKALYNAARVHGCITGQFSIAPDKPLVCRRSGSAAPEKLVADGGDVVGRVNGGP